MYSLVYSVKDPAGYGVAHYIVEKLGLDRWVCDKCVEAYVGKNFILAGFSEDVIYFDFLDERLPQYVKSYIVLSRHSSSMKVKSYTVHHTGNFGEALYGGKPRRLAVANPVVSHKLLILLNKYCHEYNRCGEYEVSYEATHHGPTEVSKPLSFIEIGSSLDEWVDKNNHMVLGDAIIEFLDNDKHDCFVVAGFGGGHYPRKHTEYALNNNYCYGHIMAKYALEYLSKEVIDLMVDRSMPKPRALLVEKKGTRVEHRDILSNYCIEKGLEIIYI